MIFSKPPKSNIHREDIPFFRHFWKIFINLHFLFNFSIEIIFFAKQQQNTVDRICSIVILSFLLKWHHIYPSSTCIRYNFSSKMRDTCFDVIKIQKFWRETWRKLHVNDVNLVLSGSFGIWFFPVLDQVQVLVVWI